MTISRIFVGDSYCARLLLSKLSFIRQSLNLFNFHVQYEIYIYHFHSLNLIQVKEGHFYFLSQMDVNTWFIVTFSEESEEHILNVWKMSNVKGSPEDYQFCNRVSICEINVQGRFLAVTK